MLSRLFSMGFKSRSLGAFMTSTDKVDVRAPAHGPESWVSDVASAAWDKTRAGADFVKDELKASFDKHPILTTIGCGAVLTAVGIPLTRFGYENVGARVMLLADNEIQTAQPFRSLIPIRGYGGSKFGALRMERIIADARDGVFAGDLKTGSDVERRIAEQYMPGFRKYPVEEMQRDYPYAVSMDKHGSYFPSFEKLTGRGWHVAKANIAGEDVSFISTRVDRLDSRIEWEFPSGTKALDAARGRIDSLFSHLVAQSGERTPQALSSQLDRVAELEWLNAQTWKYARGSAGISQLESRTWMEVAGIDSGRYAKGIDPNLEALSRTLPDFKAAYPSFFKKPPAFFKSPKFQFETPITPAIMPMPAQSVA